jgi:hypothetical protein
MKPDKYSVNPADVLPRIFVENEVEATDVVIAASEVPQVFPGGGADAYTTLTPPFVVGTKVSRNVITVWQEAAEHDLRAADYLAQLGVGHESRQAA